MNRLKRAYYRALGRAQFKPTCETCIFFRGETTYPLGTYFACIRKSRTVFTPLKQYSVHADCHELNKHNACPYYRNLYTSKPVPRWWQVWK